MIGIQQLLQNCRFANSSLATHNHFTAFAHDSLPGQKFCFSERRHTDRKLLNQAL